MLNNRSILDTARTIYLKTYRKSLKNKFGIMLMPSLNEPHQKMAIIRKIKELGISFRILSDSVDTDRLIVVKEKSSLNLILLAMPELSKYKIDFTCTNS